MSRLAVRILSIVLSLAIAIAVLALCPRRTGETSEEHPTAREATGDAWRP